MLDERMPPGRLWVAHDAEGVLLWTGRNTVACMEDEFAKRSVDTRAATPLALITVSSNVEPSDIDVLTAELAGLGLPAHVFTEAGGVRRGADGVVGVLISLLPAGAALLLDVSAAAIWDGVKAAVRRLRRPSTPFMLTIEIKAADGAERRLVMRAGMPDAEVAEAFAKLDLPAVVSGLREEEAPEGRIASPPSSGTGIDE